MLKVNYKWANHLEGWKPTVDAIDDRIEGIRVSIMDENSFNVLPIEETTHRINERLQSNPIGWIEARPDNRWILHLDRLFEELAPEHRRHWLSGPVLQAPSPAIAASHVGGFATIYTPQLQFWLCAGMQSSAKRVFLVHGHDEVLRESTARLLQRLQLDPVILHEQVNEGRTLIEKFEGHADVSYAVVLLTADDIGGKPNPTPPQLRPRARQNVVLELGFFLSRLGRERVCVLCEEGVEIPSDFLGVVYVKLDRNGAWQKDLARELRNAGLPVDMNRQ